MNFFENQEIAKKKSDRLMWLFIAVLTSVSSSIALLCTTIFMYGQKQGGPNQSFELFYVVSSIFSDPMVFKIFFLGFAIVSLVIFIISWTKVTLLRSNPEQICISMGARELPSDTKDFHLKRYRNIVEEMSIASSVPMPKVFYIEDEAINAFACGFDINSAAICMTTGSLKKLNRDEIQGVVAHEFSHILNGDMNINLKLIGYIAGLICIYEVGYWVMRSSGRSSSRNSKERGGGGIGIALMVIGGVGWGCAAFLKSAISRQREYLADASSVQFTRNPNGIMGALKKIHINSMGGMFSSPKAAEASHMFFADGIQSMFSLATHPPIEDRIRAVDASFDMEKFEKVEAEKIMADMLAQEKKSSDEHRSSAENKSSMDALHRVFPGGSSGTAIDKVEQLSKLSTLFFTCRSLLHETGGASKFISEIFEVNSQFSQLSPLEKIKVLELSSGHLKNISKVEKVTLLKDLKIKIMEDDKVDFEEFIVFSYLKNSLLPEKLPLTQLSKNEFKEQAQMIINFMLIVGTKEEKNRVKVLKALKLLGTEIQLQSNSDISYNNIMKAMSKLRFSQNQHKKELVGILKQVMQFDGVKTQREDCFYRLMCQILSVPA